MVKRENVSSAERYERCRNWKQELQILFYSKDVVGEMGSKTAAMTEPRMTMISWLQALEQEGGVPIKENGK